MSYYKHPPCYLNENAKILKVTCTEIEHSYWEWKWRYVLLKWFSLLCWYTLSHCHGWLVKGTALQQLHWGWSGSWHHQVHLQGTVQVYITSRSLDGFQLLADCCRTTGAVPAWLGGDPVYGICVHCGKCTTGGALHGACSVAAGVATVGVVGVTAVGSLSAWVAGADVDAAGATLPILDVSGLTASRWCSQMWSWAHLYYPPLKTWTRYKPLLALWIMVVGAIGSWHH